MINKITFFRFLLLLTVLLAGITVCVAQSTFIQHYTTKDGLPSNNCYSILQDSHQFIWVATDAGVSRFDGQRFENFTIDDGMPDNQVLQIKEDNKGRIWFLAFNGEMSYFHNGKIYNSTNDQALGLLKFDAVIISIFHDKQNRLWFGTNKNQLFMFDGKRLFKFSSTDYKNQFTFSYASEDASGKIWIYSQNNVRLYNNGKFSLVNSNTPAPPSYHKMIAAPHNNTMWYLDKKGLNYKSGKLQKLVKPIDPKLTNLELGYFHVDRKDLWLSSQDGVFHIDSSGRTIQYLRGVPTVQVIKDRQQNMWFTGSDGVYMLPRMENRMFTINKSHGLSSNVVKSVLKDREQNIWLGLEGGYLNKLDAGKKISEYRVQHNRPFHTGIKKLTLKADGKSIYFASDEGLGVISNIHSDQHTNTYLQEQQHSVFVVKDFSLKEDHSLAVALSSGVLVLNGQDKNLHFSLSGLREGKDFFKDRAYSTFYDKEGKLWFSNTRGLHEFSNGKLTPFLKNSVITKRINDIKQLPDGTLVLATDGYGLILTDGKKILHHITQLDGLASNICGEQFISGEDIWVITNKGINRICMEGNKPLVESFQYTNALLRNDVNDLYIDKGTSYFATNSGLVYFYNKTHNQLIKPPEALVTGIVVDGTKRNIADVDIKVNPLNNKITLYFTAIDFQNQDMWFRYRLKPENKWTETRIKRVDAAALEPGNYNFEVQAKTINSDWGEPAFLKFELEAKFWETTWFKLVIFALGGLCLYGIAVVVTKKQKNKEQQKLLLKNKILMLEQRALQAMMNPHFVFNVMNSIQHYINTKDTSSANKVLTGFAKLIRKNLEICTKSYISLQEELEYLELYLSLEKKRFGDKLHYEISISPDIDKEETFIPSMLLQPYIENAIWHGIMPLEEGGELKITISMDEHADLMIEVCDNGVGIDNSLKHKKFTHNSKGMNLTQERINLLNQIATNPIQIQVKQNGISGTSVKILIKLAE
ncbi:ligand-binding sensor domain-containing protein [Pedobacter sp.]|uniref:ligand-binding sensor domain-containing protein n=1 Tax=Pedobacter sp. TaxID=1411316 RepID=UPI003D7FE56C